MAHRRDRRFLPGSSVAVDRTTRQATMKELMSADRANLATYAVLANREAAAKPIRIGIIGAGATGRAIALQLGTPVPGIRLAGISNRTPANGERAFREAGILQWKRAESP